MKSISPFLLRACIVSGLLVLPLSTMAAGETELWDGLYLQTAKGKNIEVPFVNFRTARKNSADGSLTELRCLYGGLSPDGFTVIKDAAAKDIKSVFIKPQQKRGSQIYELKLLKIKKVNKDEPEEQYCTTKEWTDHLPKSRDLAGGNQYQVDPALQPDTYYVVSTYYYTQFAIFRFTK